MAGWRTGFRHAGPDRSYTGRPTQQRFESRKEGVDRNMELDDELCLCFHVSKRKVVNFIRIEQPQRVGQLAECFGAGTGCGWCRPFLTRLFVAAAAQGMIEGELPTPEAYAALRATYLKETGAQPPS